MPGFRAYQAARRNGLELMVEIIAGKNGPLGDDEELYDAPFKEAKQSVLDAFERRYFERLIARTDNNLSRAAAEAGITRYYLRELLKRHGLHRPPESPAAAAATSPRSS